MTTNPAHLDMIAEAFGLNRLPKAVRDALIEEIDVIVFRSVLFRVMGSLDDGDKEELHDVLEHSGDDFDKPYAFLKEKVSNFDEIVRDELVKVKEDSLALSEQFA